MGRTAAPVAAFPEEADDADGAPVAPVTPVTPVTPIAAAADAMGAFQSVLVGEYVFAPARDWSYTTVVVEVPERFGASINFETDDVAWLPLDEVDELQKHPGFAVAWPHLRAIVESVG